ncbi:hypothetical protein [Treponema parvum]|uniref:hypothetical protein n=1 Tax=Treponema parvum TaxID=138851 RepID=UPI001AEC2753|nr:hypothetical protein [Treponema parvum]QTQ17077.1 hypothetical protein HXT04_10460 [Treponema parvum]
MNYLVSISSFIKHAALVFLSCFSLIFLSCSIDTDIEISSVKSGGVSAETGAASKNGGSAAVVAGNSASATTGAGAAESSAQAAGSGIAGASAQRVPEGNADSADIKYNSSLGPALTSLVNTLLNASQPNSQAAFKPSSEEAARQSFFDAVEIREGLKKAGFTDVVCLASKDSSLKINAKLPSLTTSFLFQTVYRTKTGIALKLSPETLQSLLKIMPQDLQTCADLLMAPVFTGEAMTQKEYKELIGSVYGQEIASELERSLLSIKLTFSGKTETFTVPLIEILTLQNEKIFSL